jgi:hypothetical protein
MLGPCFNSKERPLVELQFREKSPRAVVGWEEVGEVGCSTSSQSLRMAAQLTRVWGGPRPATMAGCFCVLLLSLTLLPSLLPPFSELRSAAASMQQEARKCTAA